METDQIFLWSAGFILLMLCFQRWFWIVVFFFATTASGFAMLASIFHFQILGALGFLVLAGICSLILGMIIDV